MIGKVNSFHCIELECSILNYGQYSSSFLFFAEGRSLEQG